MIVINYKMVELALYNNSQLPSLKIIYFITNEYIFGQILTLMATIILYILLYFTQIIYKWQFKNIDKFVDIIV